MEKGRMAVKKRKDIWAFRASYTVEAAFVVPILLGICFMIMYILFLQHDQAVLQGNLLYVLCHEAETGSEEEAEESSGEKDTEKESAGKKTEENLLSKKLWMAKITSVKITHKLGKISGEVSYQANIWLPIITLWIRREQNFCCKGEYYNIQPEQMRVFG